MRRSALGLMILLATGTAWAQGDPGAPDSVRLENVVFAAGRAAMNVTLVNDQPLSGLQIPLHYSTDLLILDSVVFGPRTSGFAGADIVRWDTSLGGAQNTIMLAVVPLQTGSLAPGSDAIATIHFSQNGGATADTSLLRDTTLNPAGGLLLADTAASPNGYRPSFTGGMVRVALAVGDDRPTLPRQFALLPNFPNPFNPVTVLQVALPEPRHVTLDIYNLLGQRVVRLFDGPAPAGYLTLDWDGRDQSGRSLASGIYFYRAAAGDFHAVRKMVLLK